jgi:hypothetical protein
MLPSLPVVLPFMALPVLSVAANVSVSESVDVPVLDLHLLLQMSMIR